MSVPLSCEERGIYVGSLSPGTWGDKRGKENGKRGHWAMQPPFPLGGGQTLVNRGEFLCRKQAHALDLGSLDLPDVDGGVDGGAEVRYGIKNLGQKVDV